MAAVESAYEYVCNAVWHYFFGSAVNLSHFPYYANTRIDPLLDLVAKYIMKFNLCLHSIHRCLCWLAYWVWEIISAVIYIVCGTLLWVHARLLDLWDGFWSFSGFLFDIGFLFFSKVLTGWWLIGLDIWNLIAPFLHYLAFWLHNIGWFGSGWTLLQIVLVYPLALLVAWIPANIYRSFARGFLVTMRNLNLLPGTMAFNFIRAFILALQIGLFPVTFVAVPGFLFVMDVFFTFISEAGIFIPPVLTSGLTWALVIYTLGLVQQLVTALMITCFGLFFGLGRFTSNVTSFWSRSLSYLMVNFGRFSFRLFLLGLAYYVFWALIGFLEDIWIWIGIAYDWLGFGFRYALPYALEKIQLLWSDYCHLPVKTYFAEWLWLPDVGFLARFGAFRSWTLDALEPIFPFFTALGFWPTCFCVGYLLIYFYYWCRSLIRFYRFGRAGFVLYRLNQRLRLEHLATTKEGAKKFNFTDFADRLYLQHRGNPNAGKNLSVETTAARFEHEQKQERLFFFDFLKTGVFPENLYGPLFQRFFARHPFYYNLPDYLTHLRFFFLHHYKQIHMGFLIRNHLVTSFVSLLPLIHRRGKKWSITHFRRSRRFGFSRLLFWPVTLLAYLGYAILTFFFVVLAYFPLLAIQMLLNLSAALLSGLYRAFCHGWRWFWKRLAPKKKFQGTRANGDDVGQGSSAPQ